MASFRLTLIVLALSSWPALQPARPPMRVQFVGNSFTYYNNVPCLVAKMGESRGRTIQTSMIVQGGASLAEHWRSRAVKTALAERWDAVVLQTQSTFGVTYFVEGVDRIADTSSLLRDARPFRDAVAGRSVRVVLFEHWKRQAAPARDQRAIHAAFSDASRSLDATVMPAGLAWEIAGRTVQPAVLYDSDGAHPSEAGSYLAALTAYATLTGDRTSGLPASLTCPAIDGSTEKPTSEQKTLRLEAGLASQLQAAADEAVRTWKDVPIAAVPPIEHPSLPDGEPLRPADRQGTWTGTTNLYPRGLPWPATMTLVFTSPTTARLTISFGGRPDDIVRDVTVTTTGGTLRFEDTQGPNKTTIVYRGVRRGDELTGTSEFTGNPDLRGAATWTLRRTAEPAVVHRSRGLLVQRVGANGAAPSVAQARLPADRTPIRTSSASASARGSARVPRPSRGRGRACGMTPPRPS